MNWKRAYYIIKIAFSHWYCFKFSLIYIRTFLSFYIRKEFHSKFHSNLFFRLRNSVIEVKIERTSRSKCFKRFGKIEFIVKWMNLLYFKNTNWFQSLLRCYNCYRFDYNCFRFFRFSSFANAEKDWRIELNRINDFQRQRRSCCHLREKVYHDLQNNSLWL